MTRYVLIALLTLCLALGGTLWWSLGRSDSLQADIASLRASVAAMEFERNLAREAEEVAEARARHVEVKAREYDELREGILRDGEDAPIPDWLRDALVRMRTPNGQSGYTPHPE